MKKLYTLTLILFLVGNLHAQTFEEVLNNSFEADAFAFADIDNDGYTDIISLDMLPEDMEAYKTSGREYNNQIYDQYLKTYYQHR